MGASSTDSRVFPEPEGGRCSHDRVTEYQVRVGGLECQRSGSSISSADASAPGPSWGRCVPSESNHWGRVEPLRRFTPPTTLSRPASYWSVRDTGAITALWVSPFIEFRGLRSPKSALSAYSELRANTVTIRPRDGHRRLLQQAESTPRLLGKTGILGGTVSQGRSIIPTPSTSLTCVPKTWQAS